MTSRDRDDTGRPRNARARDSTGRPLPRDATGANPEDPPALPPVISGKKTELVTLPL